ncbi:hypothetical protein KMZ68_14115 [Bradyrhizobium sediminis]|uniref:SPOR domain-containing protein n=1 Tax=Bradyrhizobium sediminis TaxID=2840469 RepID=A0A975NKL6_9BRAD|nr:hypothetical protein [Bradyrhizobium sediminis]QWG16179.1 hypothetical protein KMZ68_14115 [Bradyrhizobium sediminis]
MAKNTDHLADGFEAENTGGVLSGFLAEEDEFDRRTLWRLGSWGVASVGALVLAVIVNQSSIGSRREQVAAADLARQAQQQIQSVAKESHSEARRLASAIETLNGDRDRLYTRVTVLEQGLDTVTGSIGRQNSATMPPVPAWPAAETAAVPASPPPVVAPVATTAAAATDKARTAMAAVEPVPTTVSSVARETLNPPAAGTSTPLMPAKSMMAPPDAAAGKLIEPEASKQAVTAAPMPEVASVAADAEPGAPAAAKLAVQRTEFGVDVGRANTVGGLRALWRGLLKSKSNAPLAALRPIIVVKEGSGGVGMQLRLVAGPLGDAAAAAKICAVMIENERTCETTVFDGQRLALTGSEPPAAAVKPAPRKRASPKRPVAAVEEPAKKPESSSMLTSMFTRRSQ